MLAKRRTKQSLVAGGNYTKDNCKLVVSIHNMARWTWGNDPLKVYINAMKDRI